MRRHLTLLAGLLLVMTSFLKAQSLTDSNLLECIRSFNTSAISSAGREAPAASIVKHFFPKGSVKEDRLGNLVITIGSGNPKRLFPTSLDEPVEPHTFAYCPLGKCAVGLARFFNRYR